MEPIEEGHKNSKKRTIEREETLVIDQDEEVDASQDIRTLPISRKLFTDKDGITYTQPISNKRQHNYRVSDTQSSRSWCGTYFHDGSTIGDSIDLSLPFKLDMDAIKYVTGQWERTRTGKLHLHYYVVMKEPSKVTAVRRAIDCWRGYLNVAKSEDAVLLYVTKDEARIGEVFEFGVPPPGQGRPQGKIDALNAANDGKSITYIMQQYPDQFARYHTAIAKVCAARDNPRFLEEPPKVEIYFGVTGSGKSHKAYTENPGAYRKILAGKWWDGYDNQDTVIFEEFDPSAKNEQSLPEFLKILDKYPYRIEVKGGSMQLKAKKFIFTSNINPEHWFVGHYGGEQIQAFRRRVNNILYYDQPYVAGLPPPEPKKLRFSGL